MKRYYSLNSENRILSTTDIMFPQPNQEIFDFSDDFDFDKQFEYQIIQGKLIHNPFEIVTEPHLPSLEERTAALEAATMAIMGGMQNV